MGSKRNSKVGRALNSLVERLREFAYASPPGSRVPITVRPRVGVALGWALDRLEGAVFRLWAIWNDWRDHCDVVIEPEVSGFDWDDFKCVDELVEAGERAASLALPKLRALVKNHTVIATPP